MRRPLLRRPAVTLASTLAAASLGACASAGTPAPEQVALTPTSTRVETPDGNLETHTITENRSVVQTIKVAPDVAWSKIAAVYGEFGLPVSGYIDQSKQIIARGVRLRGRLGKLRVSQVITCGSDITGDDKANTYEVTMEVGSTITPAPDGQSNVSTMIVANARPMSTSGDPVRCVSTGSLEKRIANAVLVKTAAP